MADEKEGKEGMDKLVSLFSSVDSAIRHLLSGAVITAVWVLSRADACHIIELAADHLTAAAACVLVVGFTVFSAYRLILWILGDYPAFWAGLSGPSAFPRSGCGYARSYALFLRWRHADDLPESLSGYLTYRWSVAHFAIVSGTISFVIAKWFTQTDSVLESHSCIARAVSLGLLALGIVQVVFLYRLEKELCHQQLSSPSTTTPKTAASP